MSIYWAIFIFILLCFWLTNNREKYSFVFYLIIASLILVGGLRGISVGTDTGQYIKIFDFGPIYSVDDLEAGHDIVFWIIYSNIYVLLGMIALFFFHAIIHWGLVSSSIKDIGTNCFLALLVFIAFRFSDFYLNAMRQGISLALVFYSVKYIINRNLKLFLVCICIAACFHLSVIVVIPLYWISLIKFERIPPACIILAIIFIYLIKTWLFDSIFSHLLQNEMYDVYLEEQEQHGILYYILYVVSYIFCLLFYNKKDYISNILMSVVFIGVSIQSITLVNPIFNRLSVYFTVFFALLIPRIYTYSCIRNKDRVLPTLFASLFLLSLYMLGGPAPGIVPYRFFWE